METVRSYARANQELVAAFVRYLQARGFAPGTQKEYGYGVARFVESLRATSAIEASRIDVRMFLNGMCERGLSPSNISKYTFGLRAFYKSLRFAGLAHQGPMIAIANRKLPRRIPRVLTVEEIEKLIVAASNPFERAVIEVLYSTGLRVSELVSMRLRNVDIAEHKMLVKKGKGGKDRYVLFGRHAAKAITDYWRWRPSKEFLFEAPARGGRVFRYGAAWHGCCYVDRVDRKFSVGKIRDLPSIEDARRQFDRIASKIPGFQPVPQRPYQARSINLLVQRLGHRAKLGHVHPHALRRAMACHLLQNGANLRVIQDLLGHERIATTQLYTYLSVGDLKKIHRRCHPHERGE
jgi:site-specific recombinase XerD